MKTDSVVWATHLALDLPNCSEHRSSARGVGRRQPQSSFAQVVAQGVRHVSGVVAHTELHISSTHHEAEAAGRKSKDNNNETTKMEIVRTV